MAELEEVILRKVEFKPNLRYIGHIFFLWEYGEESFRSFINSINKIHQTIKLLVE